MIKEKNRVNFGGLIFGILLLVIAFFIIYGPNETLQGNFHFDGIYGPVF